MKIFNFLFIAVITSTSMIFFKATKAEKKEVVEDHSGHKHKSTYYCPMHPQVTSDKPGATCSICGMNLVLLEDEDDIEENEEEVEKVVGKNTEKKKNLNRHRPSDRSKVKLSLDRQQMIGVKVVVAEKQTLFKSIRAPGRIAFDPELYTAQSEYLEGLRQWEKLKSSPLQEVKRNTKEMINSSKIRLKVLGLSEDQIKSLKKIGRQTEGLLVGGKGQKNWIYADVFERDLPHIKKNLSADISGSFLQGKTLPAKVISVDQVIDPKTRTAKVRLQLLKSDSSIRPESYVNVHIHAPLGEHLAVPIEALMDTGREIFVFVKKGKGRFEPRKVQVLLESDEHAAIVKGVLEGEEVVVGGNFMLDSESRLKAVLKRAIQ